MISVKEKGFIRISFVTIVVTLLVILAGGVVRSTGSGMGCPDWPKCFGQYVPPTKVDELPSDYKEKYVAIRVKKNERFANYLDKLGKSNLADSIRQDQTILQPEEFNAAKTWTEYINRLVGALTGLMLLATAISSFAYRKVAKRIVVLSILNLFVVGYQAWLGSIVVSTNLMQWIVTVHMLLALVILAILIYNYNYAKQLASQETVVMGKLYGLRVLIFVSLLLSICQIVLGTEVRESIDVIAKSLFYNGRNTWISKLGQVFSYHRDMAIVITLTNALIYKSVKDKFGGKALPLSISNFVIGTIFIQLLSGFVLAYYALPPVAQAIHILCSTLLFSLQFYMYLLVYQTKTYKK